MMSRGDTISALEERLGYRFGDADLLKLALVHRSLVNETDISNLDSNERLEFLGDAALGLVVAEFLYERFPDRLEGDLTTRRAALVNLESLAHCAEEVGLADFVSTGGGDLLSRTTSRKTILGRSYEAVLGAIFLDGGMESVRGVLSSRLEAAASDPEFGQKSPDNKSRLQVLLLQKLKMTPDYEVLRTSGPDHEKWYEVEVRLAERVLALGEGSSVQRAEQAAAGIAYGVLLDEGFAEPTQNGL